MPEHINIDVDFDNSIDVTQVVNEDIVVSSVANFKGTRYVERLKFIPSLSDPTKLPVIAGLTKVEGVAPNPGEYRIVEQTLNLTHPSPHMIEFNAAQKGNSYLVTYWRYAESQDKEKVVYNDLIREITKSDGITLTHNTTQIFIGARSYFYFHDKIIIEDDQVVVSDSLSPSTTYYVYCDEFAGANSYEGIYSVSVSAPSFSSPKLGWYNGKSKAICKFTTNSGSNINFIENYGYNESAAKILRTSESITINNFEYSDVIECNTSTKGISITLNNPSIDGKRLKIINANGNGRTKIVAQINGKANTFLDFQSSYISIYWSQQFAEWKIEEYYEVIKSGLITCSEFRNRNLGNVLIQYDNLIGGPFLVGSTVTGATTAASGVIIHVQDTGGNTGLLRLAFVINGGIFVNNETITDFAGSSALINEPSGSNKNMDTYIYHETGRDIVDWECSFVIAPAYSYTNSFFPINTDHQSINSFGNTYKQININEIDNKTGADGFTFINDSGGVEAVDIQDWYYENILKIRIK